jgi:PKD repeat protein
MDSVFSFVVGLLTVALSLLGFVQQHPELPQASRDQAQQIAQQAITQATQTLSNAAAKKTVAVASNSSNLVVTPASGVAPLNVSFSVPSTGKAGTYIVEYGDGQRGSMDGVGRTDGRVADAHWYNVPGTYTVKVSFADGSCKGETCGDVSPSYLGTAIVTVYKSNSSTNTEGSLTAKPASGAAPLYLYFSTSGIGNYITYHVDLGNGSSQVNLYKSTVDCEAGRWCSGATYNTPGTFTAKLYSGSVNDKAGTVQGDSVLLGSATVTVTGAPNATFSASPEQGSAPLTTTFTLQGLEAGRTYSFDYGDNSSMLFQGDCYDKLCGGRPGSHIYASAGTYLAVLKKGSNCTSGADGGPSCASFETVRSMMIVVASGN